MLTKLRPFIMKFIASLAQHIDVDPNNITLIGLALSFFVIIFASIESLKIMVPIMIAFSSIADMLDGAVARAKNRVTIWGGVLDSFCDRIEEFNYLLSLMILGVDSLLLYFVMLISFLISYLRVLGEKLGVKVEGVGILERGERVILILISSLVIVVSESYGVTIATIVLLTMAFLGIITVIQRLYHIFKALSKS